MFTMIIILLMSIVQVLNGDDINEFEKQKSINGNSRADVIMCMYCLFCIQIYIDLCRNSQENSQDIITIISLNDKIIYSGFIKAYELPRLLEKRNMKIGFYKVSAKLNNVLIEQRFFYFLQKTIWIDFDCANSNSLLISKYYRQIPL